MRLLSRDVMQQLLHRVEENNIIKISDMEDKTKFLPFVCNGVTFGYVKSQFASKLSEFQDTFTTDDNRSLRLTARLEKGSVQERTHSVAAVTKSLQQMGLIKGWRDELLPVVSSYDSDPIFLLERAAYPIFATRGYGIHLNGYVRKPGGEVYLWVARRSKTKQTWPGMLDHIVAGGLPYGISLRDNVIKECGEEASIPVDVASRALPVGAVSYVGLDEDGNVKRDVLFCYDLELPASFVPVPCDGEVEAFELKSIDWVIGRIASGGLEGYKPNCNLVVIDFLIRRGFIDPDSPLYLKLVGALRPSDSCS